MCLIKSIDNFVPTHVNSLIGVSFFHCSESILHLLQLRLIHTVMSTT